jgi:hypothetical protein
MTKPPRRSVMLWYAAMFSAVVAWAAVRPLAPPPRAAHDTVQVHAPIAPGAQPLQPDLRRVAQRMLIR